MKSQCAIVANIMLLYLVDSQKVIVVLLVDSTNVISLRIKLEAYMELIIHVNCLM